MRYKLQATQPKIRAKIRQPAKSCFSFLEACYTTPMGEKKTFVKPKVDEARLANRFGVERDDVKAALESIENSRTQSIELTVTKRKEELQEYLEEVYDRLARSWNYENMIEMMAVAHTELVARAIADPQAFGHKGLKALHEISGLLYAPQKATVKKTLVPGDSAEKLLQRLQTRFLQAGPQEPLIDGEDPPI